MARKSRSRKPRLDALSLADVRALYQKLAQKELSRLPELKARHAELSKELRHLAEEIAAIEGAALVPAQAVASRPAVKKGVKKAAAKSPSKKAAPAKKTAPTKKSASAKKSSPAKKTTARKSAPKKKAASRSRASSKSGGPTLREAIRQVLSSSPEPLSPKEIRDAIVSQDLVKNRTRSFHQQVTGTLSRNPEFKRVVAGKYSI